MAPKAQPSIAELTKQIAELSEQLEKRKDSIKDELRQQIDQLLAGNEVSLTDVYPELIQTKKKGRGRPKGSRGPVSAKFKNPETNETWAGRGRCPAWVTSLLKVRNISLEDFKNSPEFAA